MGGVRLLCCEGDIHPGQAAHRKYAAQGREDEDLLAPSRLSTWLRLI